MMLALLHRLRTRAREERGTSLVELTVSGIVVSVIAASVLTVWARSQSDAINVGKRRDYINETRHALQLMTRDIRQATKVIDTRGDRIEIDTLINGSAYRVKYWTSGTRLWREVNAGADTLLVNNLTSTTVFTYTTIDSLLQQVNIAISVVTDVPPTGAATFASAVQLRNIG